ncbi:MAG: phosphoadenylyl-sulfate reductase [Paracoccaceae bacterium]|nr:phosphoadenylyl-sulfate reductase [Paracoccaceae bacterium]MDG1737767.1 phosphoadenylyl-sulfate reductase [Paracoccaceae bacterium]MDG2260108.1 phosphoadenylyl-sulfate reductase [Paracoccaceae bacterium]
MQHDIDFTRTTPFTYKAPEAPTALEDKVSGLNTIFKTAGARSVLKASLDNADLGRVALVSSFGTDSVVLLHMASIIDKSLPVIFIDTEMLFHETLVYQAQLTIDLGLWNVRIIRPDEHEVHARDPNGNLYQSSTQACCALRKTRPLNRTLEGFDSWISGRKRFQSGTRAQLDYFEAEEETGRIKVNPLAHWSLEDIKAYMDANDLPRHPLISKGYPSIGCAPCTSKVAEGDDPRSGRWSGSTKTECGIHLGAGAAK